LEAINFHINFKNALERFTVIEIDLFLSRHDSVEAASYFHARNCSVFPELLKIRLIRKNKAFSFGLWMTPTLF